MTVKGMPPKLLRFDTMLTGQLPHSLALKSRLMMAHIVFW